jgi:hypothetical protein
MSMIGKWVTIPDPEDNCYWRDGEITDEVGAGVFLIRLRNVAEVTEAPQHSRLFSITDLAEAVFFENEAELIAFREWTTEKSATILKFEK